MLSNGFTNNKERKILTTEKPEEFTKYKEFNKNSKIIGTHSGTFHGDEVLATLLLKYHPTYENSIIVRTRNKEILNQCDLICDVGGEYNLETNRFDHHMSTFNETFNKEHTIKLSSAGLVFKHFGKDIVINILQKYGWYEKNKEHIDEFIEKIYKDFIESVDGRDNGIENYPIDILPKYKEHSHYSSRIARLNPSWIESGVDINECFAKAWDVAEEEIYYLVKNLATSYFIAIDIVKQSLKNLEKYPSLNNKVLILGHFCPWKHILLDLEVENKMEGQILFVIFQGNDGGYRISTVPLNKTNDYAFRKGLPEAWRGRRDEELAKISGISDITFVHSSGFIGGAKSFESILKMAELAIK